MLRPLLLPAAAVVVLAACRSLPVASVDELMKEDEQLYAQKRYDEAVRRFGDALGKDAGHWPAHHLRAWLDLGKSLWNAGECGQALDALNRVLALNPRHEEALRFLLQR